jgi:Aldo/keto reductase family
VIATARFGRTGHDSSRVIFGAAALGHATQAEADRALELLLAHGVNHIDTAASYGDSELRVAPWLKRHPGAFFVATKTGERGYREAREEIRRSLDRLGVDSVDLIQLHNLVDVIEWEFALREDGAAGGRRGARRGPCPLHRRHRARPVGRRHAPAQSRALPVRLGASPVQLPAAPGRALRRPVRGARPDLRRA